MRVRVLRVCSMQLGRVPGRGDRLFAAQLAGESPRRAALKCLGHPSPLLGAVCTMLAHPG